MEIVLGPWRNGYRASMAWKRLGVQISSGPPIMRIFFAGPLTNLQNPDKTKAFYDELGMIAQNLGFEFFWAFRNGTDPILNPEVTPQEVFKRDTEELAKSDLMVAYVGEPSVGTGEEIEFAREKNIPVVLMYEQTQPVSRMLRGNPIIKKELVYTTDEEGIRLFTEFLKELSQTPNLLK